MTSQINGNSIDQSYPIAGKDQPSQGFRTNFQLIEDNFNIAAAEITDLQNKAVLKSALNGTVLNNDMQGNPILSASMRDLRLPLASLNFDPNDLNTIDIVNGGLQLITLGGDNQYVTQLQNFSRGNSYSAVLLQVNNSNGNNTIILPQANIFYGLENISYANVAANGTQGILNFYGEGTALISISSSDGQSYFVTDLTRKASTLNYGEPENFPTGRSGDKQGDMAVQGNVVYICTQNFNGIDQVWVTAGGGGGGGGGGAAGTEGSIQINTGGDLGAVGGFLYSTTQQAFAVPGSANIARGLTVQGQTGIGINVQAGAVTTQSAVNGNIQSARDVTAARNIVAGADVTATNVTATNFLGGTLTTAAQPNITSVGTLSALAVTGQTSINGVIYPSTTGSQGQTLILGPGGTTLSFGSISAQPGGDPLSVQYNDSGQFNGLPTFTVTPANGQVSMTTLNVLQTAVAQNLNVTNTANIATAGIDSLRANSVNVNGAYTLPTVPGVNAYVMTSDGAGSASWQALPAASTYGNSQVAAFLANFGSNSIVTVGNVSAGNVLTNNLRYANGQPWDFGAATYSNANVAAFLAVFGSNSIVTTGNISAGNVSVSGTGHLIGNLLATSANVTTDLEAGNLLVRNNANIDNDVTIGNALIVNEVYANNVNNTVTVNADIDAANVLGSNITAFGNITASTLTGNGYYFGNGRFLTGLATGGSPGGANTEIQFNDDGAFAGRSNFTYNRSTGNVDIGTNLNVATVTTDNVIALLANVRVISAGFGDTEIQSNISNLLITGGNFQAEGNTILGETFIGAVDGTANLIINGLATISNTLVVSETVTGGNLQTAGEITAKGSNTQLQFNNDGNLAGNTQLSWDYAANILSINATADIANLQATVLAVVGNVDANNFIASNSVSAADITATAGISAGGNIIAEGNVSANNAVFGNNISAGSNVSVVGNISANNASISADISANNAVISNNISAGNNVDVVGNISANNASISNSISVGSNVSVVGNISANNASISADISANNAVISNNVSAAANVTVGGNLAVSANAIFASNVIVSGYSNTAGNVNALANLNVSANAIFSSNTVTAGYSNTAGNVNALANLNVTSNAWFSANAIVSVGPVIGNLVSGVSDTVSGVAYNQGYYVAALDSGNVLTSRDGISWSEQSTGNANALNNIQYVNNRFIAVGANGRVSTSDTGASWNNINTGNSISLTSIAYAPAQTRYVAVGYANTLLQSSNLATWTAYDPAVLQLSQAFSIASNGTSVLTLVGWGDDAFSTDPTVRVSTNGGNTWSARTIAAGGNLNGITFGNGIFLAVGESGRVIASNPTYSSFVDRTSNTTANLQAVAYAGEEFLAVAANGQVISSNDNGVNWQPVPSTTTESLQSVTYTQNGYILGGENGTLLSYDSQGNVVTNNVYTSQFSANGIVNLGQSYNVKIQGGNVGETLITDGAGNLEWGMAMPAAMSVTFFDSTTSATAPGLYAYNGASSPDVGLSLPESNASLVGQVFNIKDISGAPPSIFISTGGADFIDGTTSVTLSGAYENYQIVCIAIGTWGVL